MFGSLERCVSFVTGMQFIDQTLRANLIKRNCHKGNSFEVGFKHKCKIELNLTNCLFFRLNFCPKLFV